MVSNYLLNGQFALEFWWARWQAERREPHVEVDDGSRLPDRARAAQGPPPRESPGDARRPGGNPGGRRPGRPGAIRPHRGRLPPFGDSVHAGPGERPRPRAAPARSD